MANGSCEVTTNGERDVMANDESEVVANGATPQSPPRRGIWDWARAGTGKLNIIGRLPHPEWKSPGTASKASGLVVNGAQRPAKTDSPHDDFSIPSTTATEPDNLSQQQLTAAAKIEGLGISALSPMMASMSPHDFSQTRGSSDDLIANMSETTGSPSPMLFKHADDTTPKGSRAGSPVGIHTPTPPHGRSDSIMDIPKLRGKQHGGETRNASKTVERQDEQNAAAPSPSPSTTTSNAERPATPREGASQSVQTVNGNGDAPPRTNGSAPASPARRRIPTYKIALASSFLPHGGGRRSASAAQSS